MLIFTDPSGIIFFRANNSIPTSNQMITKKITIAAIIVITLINSSFLFLVSGPTLRSLVACVGLIALRAFCLSEAA
jgi:hypothetical protein